jgi:preprotein translocase subunit Sss1
MTEKQENKIINIIGIVSFIIYVVLINIYPN